MNELRTYTYRKIGTQETTIIRTNFGYGKNTVEIAEKRLGGTVELIAATRPDGRKLVIRNGYVILQDSLK